MINHNFSIVNNFQYFIQTEKGLSPNTIKSYISDISSFLEYVGKKVEDIDNSNLIDYFVSLQGIGIISNSLARKRSSIVSFFNFLIDEDMELNINIKNLPKIKFSKKLPVALSIAEMKRMLEFFDKRDKYSIRNRAILEFMYATGTRVSEVIDITLQDIFWEDSLVRVLGKGSKQRFIPILDSTTEYLKDYLNNSRDKLLKYKQSNILFLNRLGGRFSRMGMWKIVETATVGCSIKKNVSPHTIRHTFATHLLEGGANLRVIQLLLGHQSINTTQIYTNIDTNFIKKVHKKYHPRG